MTREWKYELGSTVKDTITGFKGTVTARVEYISGYANYRVEPNHLATDGKVIKGEWFDEARLVRG